MNIRQKMMVAFGVLLLALVGSGVYMLRQVGHLGQTVDIILRENYQSVIICQKVNEALERIDSHLLFSFTERQDDATFQGLIETIDDEWKREMNNLTVPTEGERARHVRGLLDEYMLLLPKLRDGSLDFPERLALYRKEAYPRLLELKGEINGILSLNQNNMTETNNLARSQSASLFRQSIALLVGCLAFLGFFSLALVNWIQNPLRHLIAMTNEIANGNLSLALDSKSNDEIGQLSRSFNRMAIALRGARSQLEGKLHQQKRLNKDVFEKLPSPIVVVDARTRRIELATENARKNFNLSEGGTLEDSSCPWLVDFFEEVRKTATVTEPEGGDGMVQHFIANKEFFFQPTAVPLPADAAPEDLTGVVIILKDVTQAHEQRELKRSVISTVSHQLRTPLTSLQMSVYLLLEERLGPLNPEQLDLVMAMRDDSRRLTGIIGDLLDWNKAEKSVLPAPSPCDAAAFLLEAHERHLAEAQDHEVELLPDYEPGLPKVSAVAERISYVFDNLIGNALRFTPPGGRITLSARKEEGLVAFFVRDTGCGIPTEVLPHVFEPFYRAPGQNSASGVGLGLSIVREIISAHGGKIDVKSEGGQGACFRFTLPVSE